MCQNIQFQLEVQLENTPPSAEKLKSVCRFCQLGTMGLKFLLFLALLLVWGTTRHQVNARLVVNRSHVADSFRSLVSGVGSQLARGFPRPKELLRQSKQLFIGLPERAVFGTIHQLCEYPISISRVSRVYQGEKNMFC